MIAIHVPIIAVVAFCVTCVTCGVVILARGTNKLFVLFLVAVTVLGTIVYCYWILLG